MSVQIFTSQHWCLLLGFCLACSQLFAQSRTISGTVTDEANDAIPGVNVLVKGTTSGTVTDIEG